MKNAQEIGSTTSKETGEMSEDSKDTSTGSKNTKETEPSKIPKENSTNKPVENKQG